MSTGREQGFTMIELMVTISLAGILMVTATWTFLAYLNSSREQNTAVEIRAALRNTGERALSEGRTYCVYFDSGNRTYTTYRSDCTIAANAVAPATTDATNVGLASISFPPPTTAIPNQRTACLVTNACAYFYPRGTALAGSLSVTRTGSSRTYQISVEGLTSRVSLA